MDHQGGMQRWMFQSSESPGDTFLLRVITSEPSRPPRVSASPRNLPLHDQPLSVFIFFEPVSTALQQPRPKMTAKPVFKLAPGIQLYDWGKKGSASLAAQLGSVCIPDFEVDEGKTYAEVSVCALTLLLDQTMLSDPSSLPCSQL